MSDRILAGINPARPSEEVTESSTNGGISAATNGTEGTALSRLGSESICFAPDELQPFRDACIAAGLELGELAIFARNKPKVKRLLAIWESLPYDEDPDDQAEQEAAQQRGLESLIRFFTEQLGRTERPTPLPRPSKSVLPTPEAVEAALREAIEGEMEVGPLAEIVKAMDEFSFGHSLLLEGLGDDGWEQHEQPREDNGAPDKGSKHYCALFAARFLRAGLAIGPDRDRLLLLNALSQRLYEMPEAAPAIARLLNLQLRPGALEQALAGTFEAPFDASPEFVGGMPSGVVDTALARAQAESEADARKTLKGMETEVRGSAMVARYVALIVSALTCGAPQQDIASLLQELVALSVRGGFICGIDTVMIETGGVR